MTDAPKFNLRNPAVKRIMQEMKEIKQDTSGDFIAEALETDIFEWHFVIRGPRDTEFEGGIYHGRILLPAEYPFKPPSFMMLSPNGRFETGVKICLSISSHHPEHWQPSWSVRTALTAMIAFMPSPGAGALGALDFPKEERRLLAARSRAEPPRFGGAERQRVIEEMHARMLAIAAEKDAERAAAAASGAAAQASSSEEERTPADRPAEGAPIAEPAAASQPAQADSGQAEGPSGQEAAEAAKPSGTDTDGAGTAAAAGCADGAARPAVVTAASAEGASTPRPAAAAAAPSFTPLPAITHASTSAAASTSSPAQPAPVTASARAPTAAGPAHVHPAAAVAAPAQAHAAALAAAATAGPTSADHMLTALMWALYVGIGAILLRKVMGAWGVDLQEVLNDLMH